MDSDRSQTTRVVLVYSPNSLASRNWEYVSNRTARNQQGAFDGRRGIQPPRPRRLESMHKLPLSLLVVLLCSCASVTNHSDDFELEKDEAEFTQIFSEVPA